MPGRDWRPATGHSVQGVQYQRAEPPTGNWPPATSHRPRRALPPMRTRRWCRGSREVFGSEPLELLLDRVEDAAVFVREVGQRAEAGHPGRPSVPGPVPVRAAPELFLERFGEEAPQGDAAGGGKRPGLPQHGIGKIDGRLHRAMLPRRRHVVKPLSRLAVSQFEIPAPFARG